MTPINAAERYLLMVVRMLTGREIRQIGMHSGRVSIVVGTRQASSSL